MPPIKVHIDDPITPKKADGVIPQTSDSPTAFAGDNKTTQQSSLYPAARPGQAVGPAPTPYVPAPQDQPMPTRTSQTANQYAPPAPQPGAVPVPLGQQQQVSVTTSPLPPPPKAGEKMPEMPVTTMPPQMGLPAPQQNYTPTRSTNAYSTPERADAPTTINFGAVPAPSQTTVGSHPPGYHQDVNAQEMTSTQRASLEAEERRGSFYTGQNLGLGGGSTPNELSAGSLWNSVKDYASFAGNKLAETEKEVWKRINKQ